MSFLSLLTSIIVYSLLSVATAATVIINLSASYIHEFYLIAKSLLVNKDWCSHYSYCL